MTQDEIIIANAKTTQRLADLAARCTPADLARDLGGGWVIASAFAHLTFWDRRAAFLLQRWQEGLTVPHDVIPWYDDVLNDTIEAWYSVLPNADMPRLCLEAAKVLEDMIKGAPQSLIDEMVARDDGWLLDRTGHRTEHIEQIEAGLR